MTKYCKKKSIKKFDKKTFFKYNISWDKTGFKIYLFNYKNKMVKTIKTTIVALVIAAFWFIMMNQWQAQETADVYLTITEGTLTITATGELNLWTMPISTSEEVMSWQFSTNSFYVTDFKWSASGYRTTIQVTDLTWLNAGTEYSIPAANVELKSAAANPTLMTGTANAEVTLGSIDTTYQAINSPITYFARNNWTIGGRLSQYWDSPWVQVTIPAFQAPAEYRGTITFTLYEPGN